MNFEHSPRTDELLARLSAFQEQEIDPREEAHMRELAASADPGVVSPLIEELKAKAKAEGLWNLFLPDEEHGTGLSSVEHAPLAERMGRSLITAEV
jgi:acyl-CoA dehydrogenase